jgi:hypothetical protein
MNATLLGTTASTGIEHTIAENVSTAAAWASYASGRRGKWQPPSPEQWELLRQYQAKQADGSFRKPACLRTDTGTPKKIN